MKVIFSHGKESGPWGGKIQRLAKSVQALGWGVDSIDYQGLDLEARVTRLQQYLAENEDDCFLVGSSMGAAVSLACHQNDKVKGLFLMAPAVYMPGYEDVCPEILRCPCTIVHGWSDEVVPVSNAIRYADKVGANLHVLAADHRLMTVLDQVDVLFCNHLQMF